MIPDFQSIMLPLLESFKEGEIKSSKELRLDMINHFNITEEEQKEKIPSGKQFVHYNRIAWAISYLKMAELIFSPKRGSYQITTLFNFFWSSQKTPRTHPYNTNTTHIHPKQ